MAKKKATSLSTEGWSELELVAEGMEQGATLARQLLVGHAYEVPDKGQFVLEGKQYRLDENAPEVARRAATYLAALGTYIIRCQRNDLSGMLKAMFSVGYLAREVFLAAGAEKPAEEAVETSYKVSRRSRANIQTVNSAHLELQGEYAAAVTELMASGMKYSPATDEVAKRMGVNGRTVRNNFPNPNPQPARNRKP